LGPGKIPHPEWLSCAKPSWRRTGCGSICWRPANWSFVYGDRVSAGLSKAFGTEPSLKEALERYRPLVAAADARIHALAQGAPVSEPARFETSYRAGSETGAPALTPEEELPRSPWRKATR